VDIPVHVAQHLGGRDALAFERPKVDPHERDFGECGEKASIEARSWLAPGLGTVSFGILCPGWAALDRNAACSNYVNARGLAYDLISFGSLIQETYNL
jgi:hypothetical protein